MTDRELLQQVMTQLYRWAAESKASGWSTNQIDPQRALASRISEHLATTESKQDLNALSIARGVEICLRCPRGSEAQIRCLEEVGQDAEWIIKNANGKTP